jgi:hypothetical protein
MRKGRFASWFKCFKIKESLAIEIKTNKAETKGGFMRNKFGFGLVLISIPIWVLFTVGTAWADTSTPFSPGKVGDEAFSFVLPSSQGKLVDYYKDYYGKYHLVMTFFPAAFTPV